MERFAKWIETVQNKGDNLGPVAKAQLQWAEAELALAKGKRSYDKRRSIAEREAKREMAKKHS